MKELSSLIKQHPDFTDLHNGDFRTHEPTGAAVHCAFVHAAAYNRYWIVFFVTQPHLHKQSEFYQIVEKIAGCNFL
jgi:hypothetical protein